MEIVRTEPRDLAPVIPLPVRFEGNRVVEPMDVAPGTVLPLVVHDLDSHAPGPLARALMALQAAGTR